MSCAMNKAWSVAASVGGVEGLKEQQGVCRWNHALRCTNQQHLKNYVTSFFPAENNTCAFVATKSKGEKAMQAEESLRTVMYLSCWGPY